eukprot:SAG11_NODE_6777_length_1250_cov_89.510860_3_plen_96_part_00
MNINFNDLPCDIKWMIFGINRRDAHLKQIQNYVFPLINGYRFTDDDPYEHYVYDGRKYETLYIQQQLRCYKQHGRHISGRPRWDYHDESSDSDDD